MKVLEQVQGQGWLQVQGCRANPATQRQNRTGKNRDDLEARFNFSKNVLRKQCFYGGREQLLIGAAVRYDVGFHACQKRIIQNAVSRNIHKT